MTGSFFSGVTDASAAVTRGVATAASWCAAYASGWTADAAQGAITSQWVDAGGGAPDAPRLPPCFFEPDKRAEMQHRAASLVVSAIPVMSYALTRHREGLLSAARAGADVASLVADVVVTLGAPKAVSFASKLVKHEVQSGPMRHGADDAVAFLDSLHAQTSAHFRRVAAMVHRLSDRELQQVCEAFDPAVANEATYGAAIGELVAHFRAEVEPIRQRDAVLEDGATTLAHWLVGPDGTRRLALVDDHDPGASTGYAGQETYRAFRC
jgi:hypothetical protein